VAPLDGDSVPHIDSMKGQWASVIGRAVLSNRMILKNGKRTKESSSLDGAFFHTSLICKGSGFG